MLAAARSCKCNEASSSSMRYPSQIDEAEPSVSPVFLRQENWAEVHRQEQIDTRLEFLRVLLYSPWVLNFTAIENLL